MDILIDKCCHCEKDISERDNRPNGYYFLTSSIIGSTKISRVTFRLCPECYNVFKSKIESMNFFKGCAER